MAPHQSRSIAWSSAAITCAVSGIYAVRVLVGQVPSWLNSPAGEALFCIAFAICGVVGALIIRQQPSHRVGWLFIGVGLSMSLWFVDTQIGFYARDVQHRKPDDFVLWVSNWLWAPPMIGLTAILPAIFPDGNVPSRRWRFAVWLGVVAVVLVTLWYMVRPGPQDPPFAEYDNPWGLSALRGSVELITSVAYLAWMAAVFSGAAAFIARFRASVGIERLQFKWFALAACFWAVAFVVGLVPAALTGTVTIASGTQADPPFISWLYFVVIFPVSVAAIPIAAAVAILRYRLYEIDVIIERSLVYGSLTALLAGVFVGGQALLQRTFVAVTGTSSDLAVVLALFLIGAVFAPLRVRLQAFVDRRYKVLPAAAARVPLTSAEDDLVGSLERLATLHRDGLLDDTEYSRAKQRLLSRE